MSWWNTFVLISWIILSGNSTKFISNFVNKLDLKIHGLVTCERLRSKSKNLRKSNRRYQGAAIKYEINLKTSWLLNRLIDLLLIFQVKRFTMMECAPFAWGHTKTNLHGATRKQIIRMPQDDFNWRLFVMVYLFVGLLYFIGNFIFVALHFKNMALLHGSFLPGFLMFVQVLCTSFILKLLFFDDLPI